jgi:hypothetical protein
MIQGRVIQGNLHHVVFQDHKWRSRFWKCIEVSKPLFNLDRKWREVSFGVDFYFWKFYHSKICIQIRPNLYHWCSGWFVRKNKFLIQSFRISCATHQLTFDRKKVYKIWKNLEKFNVSEIKRIEQEYLHHHLAVMIWNSFISFSHLGKPIGWQKRNSKVFLFSVLSSTWIEWSLMEIIYNMAGESFFKILMDLQAGFQRFSQECSVPLSLVNWPFTRLVVCICSVRRRGTWPSPVSLEVHVTF